MKPTPFGRSVKTLMDRHGYSELDVSRLAERLKGKLSRQSIYSIITSPSANPKVTTIETLGAALDAEPAFQGKNLILVPRIIHSK